MLKFIEDLCDRATQKSFKFVVTKKDVNEIIDLIQKSTQHNKMFNKEDVISTDLTLNMFVKDGLTNYNVSTSLTNKEWTNLLRECEQHNYQLLIKDEQDTMYFTKRD